MFYTFFFFTFINAPFDKKKNSILGVKCLSWHYIFTFIHILYLFLVHINDRPDFLISLGPKLKLKLFAQAKIENSTLTTLPIFFLKRDIKTRAMKLLLL